VTDAAVANLLDVFVEFEDWMLARMPPADMRYPLDAATRWFLNAIVTVSHTTRGVHEYVHTARAHLLNDKRAIDCFDEHVKRRRTDGGGGGGGGGGGEDEDDE